VTLSLRALRLSVATPNGPFGALLEFDQGLVVLRADNSSGKSTCVQGIIYALGLEGMLSASHDVPLAHVMTDAIFDPRVAKEVPVTESYVALEVANDRDEVMTIRRYAKHPTISRDLVMVWDAPGISAAASDPPSEYFVRRPGAAQREAGFHHRLAEFIGWDLPLVPTFDESPKPLYLETLFPLFVVEQKRGWAAIQAQVPTQYRIRDVRRRALEYVLQLGSADVAAQLEALGSQATLLAQEWRERRSQLDGEVRSNGGVLRDHPTRPVATWPATPGPAVSLPMGQEWVDLESAIADVRALVASLAVQSVPTAADDRDSVRAELAVLEDRVRSSVAVASREAEELGVEEAQLVATTARLLDLDADLRRHQDLRLLRQLGGESGAGGLLPHDCPTCHQSLPETVLDEATAPRVMTIDESIGFIEQERQLFRDLEQDSQRIVEAKRAKLEALRRSIDESRQRIVALRNSLIVPDAVPSEADVERRVSARSRLQRLLALQATVESHLEEFGHLSADWGVLQTEIARLRALDFSAVDGPKRDVLQASLLDQLAKYRFSSVPVESISISENTWLPTHEGFDLGFDLSASDMIRLIWAYLLALLELSRAYGMHHAGLLVFDEPRQQMASPESFAAFIRRASDSRAFGQQVLVATSEGRPELDEMLGDAAVQVIDFGSGKVIGPEEPAAD